MLEANGPEKCKNQSVMHLLVQAPNGKPSDSQSFSNGVE